MRKQLKAGLAVGAFLFWASGAYAANDPIANVDVVVKSAKDGSIVLKTRTDTSGQVQLGSMHAGSYVLEIAGGSRVQDIATYLSQRQKADLRDARSSFADKDSQIIIDITRRGDAEGVSISRYYEVSQARTGLRFDFTVSPGEEAASRFLFATVTVKDALEIDNDLSC
jgi:hypothetical protein